MAGKKPSLDVYARPYVPQALLQANLTRAIEVPCVPPPTIDYHAYTATFAGSSFVETTVFRHASPSGEDVGVVGDSDIVQSREYLRAYQEALLQEENALQDECDGYALYHVRLFLVDPRQSMYSLFVPGLREGALRIEVGDIVRIRQLRVDHYGQITAQPMITDLQGIPITVPDSDRQYNAVVWRTDRLNEMLYIRIDYLVPRSLLFNASFGVQSGRLQDLRLAIVDMDNLLLTASHDWMRSMLFPTEFDGRLQHSLNRLHSRLDWLDQTLNFEQMRAVQAVLGNDYGHVPYLISGPPGTGKTKTVVELTRQLVEADPKAHILLCAPSDPAADLLVQRLSTFLSPQALFRLNASSRSFPEVPASILSFCHIDQEMFSLPPFAGLMQKRVVVVACRDACILSKSKVSNRDLYALEAGLHAALHPSERAVSPDLHWTSLIIDEAAQALEAEIMIPLQVIAPPPDHDISTKVPPAVVLVGDHHQLGPRTASRDPLLQRSLFERLRARPLYNDHPLSRSKYINGQVRLLTSEMLPIIRPAFTDLIQNYRSHPGILAIPSCLFYHDSLEPKASRTSSLLRWSGFQGTALPVLFAANRGPDEVETLDGGGWYNRDEAVRAITFAQSFVRESLLQQHEICIMSPFRAQVRVLRAMARSPRFGLPSVNIGPLEAFQGLESRLVIVCTTRTRDRFIDQDIARGLGVIHEPRRFNVALTRAQEGLIVIGHPDILGQDEHWLNFMAFCKRNGAMEDNDATAVCSWEKVHKDKICVPRLERQMHSRQHVQDNVHLSFGVAHNGDDTAAFWQSGVEAEIAIREGPAESDAESATSNAEVVP